MTVYQTVSAFLGRHGFNAHCPNVNAVIEGLLFDMEQGLEVGPGTGNMDSSQEMIPTWSNPPSQSPKNTSVIVIDAGGTNFRSCLVSFDGNGTPTISDLEKCSMPGIGKELSKKDFFDTIAKNLDHLKNKATRIGFCFSYAMKITPEGDGEVLSFSKEIKAKEVIGSLVGKCLSDALVERGWNRPEKIVLMNDTTAALLAGASNATEGRAYSSYVGFILGTGMNTAYIESNPIGKIDNSKAPKSQIVVCESGMYNKISRSEFDIDFDKTTNTPNRYVMEKMCSGAYLGPISHLVVKTAIEDGLFSKGFASAFDTLKNGFELVDMDRFLYAPYRTDTVLGAIAAKGIQDDYDLLFALLDAVIERAARNASALIAAAVIKTGKGFQPSLPVSVLCNGTTFYKTHNLLPRIKGYLDLVLTQERHIYFDIVTLDNDITLGTAVGALA